MFLYITTTVILSLLIKIILIVLVGLRTLCIASAEISLDFYDEWKHTYYKASTTIQNREKKLEEAAELIEQVCFCFCNLAISCFSQF